MRAKRGFLIRGEAPDLAEFFPQAGGILSLAVAAKLTTLATAESCTGGLLGAALTAFTGSSSTYLGGVITYSNLAKIRLLGIPEGVIAKWGAISPQVAGAMAAGVRNLLGSDIGIGVTGIAGPGCSERRPAGLVYVALSSRTHTYLTRLSGDNGRHGNRAAAVVAALDLLQKELSAVNGPPNREDSSQQHPAPGE
ncbi:MAG: CinA family protein [Candidatus Dormibacteria bacterium]